MFVSISTAVAPSPARTSAKSDSERSSQDFPLSAVGGWVMTVIGGLRWGRVRFRTRQWRKKPAKGVGRRVGRGVVGPTFSSGDRGVRPYSGVRSVAIRDRLRHGQRRGEFHEMPFPPALRAV